MMTDANKYLFDLHNFDSGIGFDPENPPVPTFSEEELAAARAAGFADGVKKGLADAQASRDQQMLDLTRRITTDLQVLMSGEQVRNTRFETELLSLVQALYQKTFPILNAEYGLPQMVATIQATLSSLKETSMVVIEIAPQDMEDLTDHLKSMMAQHVGQITILPQSDIEAGSFRIKWKDGGAVRNPQELAEKLSTAITATLAEIRE